MTVDTNKWLKDDIPHRIRAASARLKILPAKLNIGYPQEPFQESSKLRIWRRCETNSINEGRLAAIRWLIEFILPPTRPQKNDDVRIDRFPGGAWLSNQQEIDLLRRIKIGCDKATSHATDNSNHPDVNEPSLEPAVEIIIRHLQVTIYDAANLKLEDLAFSEPSSP